VTELEKLLATKQDRSKRLQQEKDDGAKASQAALESLRTDMERLTSVKEDLSGQLCDKNTELASVPFVNPLNLCTLRMLPGFA
jgi:hypothetical protein